MSEKFNGIIQSLSDCGLDPLWKLNDIAIFNADCFDGLRFLPALSMDLILTDPPYEAEAHTKQRRVQRGKGELVNVALPFNQITEEERLLLAYQTSRVLCQGWSITFCQIEAAMKWKEAYEYHNMDYKRTCIFRKVDGMPQYTGDRPGMGYETLITMWQGRGKSLWNGGGKHGVYPSEKYIYDYIKGAELDAWRKSDERHPTEKPVGLMKELIRDFSNEEDLVLDPFMGTGTTLVAAQALGRGCIGFEITTQWCDIAVKRLLQSPLFV